MEFHHTLSLYYLVCLRAVYILGSPSVLVYINGLPNCVCSSDVMLLADDTKCMKEIYSSKYSPHLQSDINSLTGWCESWKLHFNLYKSLILRMFLSLSNKKPPLYHLSNNRLLVTDKHKDLGVILTNNLSWEPYYHVISIKTFVC